MINWLVIVAFVIMGLLIIKISHAEKKMKLIIVAVILIFIYISATAVLSTNNIKLNSLDGVGKAISIYFSWLGGMATNLWHVSGQVIKTIGDAVKINSSSGA